MKKIILIALVLLINQVKVNGQQTCPPGINENFDNGGIQYTSTGTPGWSIDNTHFTSAPNSMRGQFNASGFTELTSNTVSTLGASTVLLKFKHICKLNSFDGGIVQIDTGSGWIQLTSLNCTYTGTSATWINAFGHRFMAASYSSTWLPGQDLAVPTNSWWKQEQFDISTLAANKASVRIRFQAGDNDANGMLGNYGWLIDDIEFCHAPCELTPPVITPEPPLLSGPVYTPGPFTLCFHFNDPSDVIASELYYSVNGSPFQATFSMQQVNPNDLTEWCGQIFITLNNHDTIQWYVTAQDGSCAGNVATYPSVGVATAIYSGSIEPPYCDYFDNANTLWVDSTVSAGGSSWELGTPNVGFVNSPKSFPNSWVVGLSTGGYLDNSNCILTSGSIDFTNTHNATIDFWLNYNTQQNSDGARLQYSTNGGTTWTTLGTINDACGTKWYNSSLSAGGGAGWSGLSQNWEEHTYKLKASCGSAGNAILGQPDVKFRFVFRSDGLTTNDGFALDNFCITKPAEDDFGVTAITSPSGGVPAGNSIPIVVTIENFGNAAQTSCNIVTTVNGTIINTFAWTGNLAAGAQVAAVLPNFTVPPGPIILCVYTTLPNDTAHSNDTLCVNLLGIPNFPLGYTDNFDSTMFWFSDADPSSQSHWELGTPNFGATNSALSPPNAWDIDLQTGYTNNAVDYLYSPYFDFTNVVNPQLIFWHNYDTDVDNDGVTLQYTVNNGGTWTTLGFKGDPNGSNWYNTAGLGSSGLPGWSGNSGGWGKSTYDLIGAPPILNKPSVQFRYIFASDAVNSSAAGFSIDDFAITKPDSNDLGIYAILSPNGATIAGHLDTVTVVLKNYGSFAQTAVNIWYRVANNAPAGPFAWSGIINPGQKINFKLPVPLANPPGNYTLCAWTALPNDAKTSNDTTCVGNIGIPIITLNYPAFIDNFENGNLNGWLDSTATPGTSWEYGTPNWHDIVTAHSPVNGWMTNISTGYADNAECYLLSPFFDLSQTDSVRLSFWQKLSVQNTFDGTRLEYSINNGLSWSTIGIQNDPHAVNWYNDNAIGTTGLPGWTGNSKSDVDFQNSGQIDGWLNSTYELLYVPALNNQIKPVRFRYVFTSDGFTNGSAPNLSGHAIDDFKLRLPCAHDLKMQAILKPGNGPAGGTSIPQVTIKNEGNATVTNFTIVYCYTPYLQPTVCVPFNYTGSIVPNGSIQTFLPPFTTPSGQYDLCVHIELATDCDQSNDTLCITRVGIPTYPLTYQSSFVDHFDSINLGWTTDNISVAAQTTNWEWGTPNYGLTTGAHSPPNCWDINLNSPYDPSSNAILYTPYFKLTNAVDPELTFWQNFFNENPWDGVNIEYSYNNSGSWSVLGLLNDPNATNWYNFTLNSGPDAWSGNSSLDLPPNTDQWVKSTYQLGSVPGMNGINFVQFRFHFTSDPSISRDGHSIDDFQIKVPIPLSVLPVSLNSITNHMLYFPGQHVNFTTKICNEGTTPVNNATVTLYVDNAIVSQDAVTYSPAMLRDSCKDHIFTNYWTATPGEHKVCVVTSNPNGTTDLNQNNDTLCYYLTVFGNRSTYPYCTSFESTSPLDKWVTANSITYSKNDNTTWEIAKPSQTILNNTYNGAKCWTLDADGNYINGDSSGLFSPMLSVSVFKCYKISFWQQFYTEQFQDGGSLSYTLDSGKSWSPINFQNTPYVTFFNYNNVAALGYANGFTGNSNGWKYYEKIIRPNVNDQMILRWQFAADLDSTFEGWSIDDFCFEDLGFCNAIGIDELTASGIGLSQNYPNPFNGHTTIDYQLPSSGKVQLIFTDVTGRMIRMYNDSESGPGSFTVDFDSKELKPGIYFYTLIFNGEKVTKRMVVTD